MRNPLTIRIAALLILLAPARTWAAAQLQAGTAFGAPGATVIIPLSLQSDTPVTALQVDWVVNPPVLTFVAVVEADFLTSHVADGALVAPNLYRVLAYSVFNEPIPNGQVLTLQAAIADSATNGPVSLVLTNALLASPSASAVPHVSLVPGTLRVGTAGTLRLSNIQSTTDSIAFEITGLSGSSFIVENSSDLVTWKTFATRPATGSSATFSAPAPLGAQRQFFRVKAL